LLLYFPYFFVFVPCTRLRLVISSAFERTLIYRIVSYRIVSCRVDVSYCIVGNILICLPLPLPLSLSLCNFCKTVVYSKDDEDYWFALVKTTATPGGTTYWLDGNPSTYRWWSKWEPNQDVRCIRYTSTGFKDRPCTNEYRFTCKMLASKQQFTHYRCC